MLCDAAPAAPASTTPAAAPQPQSGMGMMIPMLLILAIFYFMMIRPQQRKEKERRKMIEELRAGAKIVVTGDLTQVDLPKGQRSGLREAYDLLNGIEGRSVEMDIRIRPEDAANPYHKFTMRFAQDETYSSILSFRPYESLLKIDRKFSGSRRAIIHQRRSKINTVDGRLSLRIILDRYSIEVFVNGGEYVLTATICTDLCADGIEFLADGDIRMHVVKYDIVSGS